MNSTAWAWARTLLRAGLVATAAAGLLHLAGCGGGGSAADPAPPTPPPSNAQPLRTFGAPSVTPTLDNANARSADIGSRGGRLTVTHTDGTTTALEVPPGAPPASTRITMTPVTALAGLPLQGGLVTAVDLQPAGLQFAAPAVLVVNLPRTAAPRTAAFGWTGAENRFAVVPGAPVSHSGFRIAIEHFSGFGLGIAGPSQLDALAGELIDLADENERAWSALLNVAFENNCNGECDEDDYNAWAQDFWDLITKPRLDEGVAGPVQALVGHRAMGRFVVLRWFMFGDTIGQGLADLLTAGHAQDLANLKRQHDAYTRPQCSGAVADWKDWIRIPDELRARVVVSYPNALDDFPQLFSPEWAGQNEHPTGTSCVAMQADFIDPPRALGDDDFRIPLRLRTRIVHPGGELPVAARVFLDYSDGASGPAEVLTEDNGEGTFDVERDLTWPGVSVTALVVAESVQRTTVTGSMLVANLGASALTVGSVGQSLIVAAGTEVPAWITFAVDGVPIEGAEIDITFEGPGAIDFGDAVTNSWGLVWGRYTAPPHPVPRNFVATLRVQATHAGQTYQARADIQPQWADLTLEVNDGSAWQPATNRTVTVDGDGPFALRTRVQVSGELRSDPPLPAPLGSLVTLTTAEDTLAQAGNCCADLALSYLDSEGRGEAVDWRANGSVRNTQTIEAVYPDLAEGGVGASVTLNRVVAGVSVAFPYTLPVGVERPLVVTVRDNLGRPVAGAVVSTSATGGSASGGTTDDDGMLRGSARLARPDEPLVVELSVTAPGGGLIDTRTVTATAAPPVGVDVRSPLPSSQPPLFIGGHGRVYLGSPSATPYTLTSRCVSATWTVEGPSLDRLSRLDLTATSNGSCEVSLAMPVVVHQQTPVVIDLRGASLVEYDTSNHLHVVRLLDGLAGGTVVLRRAPYWYQVQVGSRDRIDVEAVFSAGPD